MLFQDHPSALDTQSLRHKLDRLAQAGPRWKFLSYILITVGLVLVVLWFFNLVANWLFFGSSILIFLGGYSLVKVLQNQLQSWHRQANEVLQETVRLENNLSSHQTILNGIDIVTGATAELLAADSVDALCRMAVELARERLNIERCGLYLIDPANPQIIRGT